MTSDDVVPMDARHMVEAAASLLDHPGMVVVAGVYTRWAVGPTKQAQACGYMAFLLPPD